MNSKFAHIPLDHLYLDRSQNAHIIDDDAVSSRLAFSIAEDAYAAGHPADSEAAPRTLAGPSGAAAVQAAMTPYVQKAVDKDQAAEQYSAEALQHARTPERPPNSGAICLTNGSSSRMAHPEPAASPRRPRRAAARDSTARIPG